MENASKALIIAASAIIAVLVLYVMIYLFTQASRVSSDYEYMKQGEMIAIFNAKFDGYAKECDVDGNKKITDAIKYKATVGPDTLEAQDPSNSFAEVISACNAAYDINKKNEYDKRNCVRIDIIIEGDDGDDVVEHPATYSIAPISDDHNVGILEKGEVFVSTAENATQTTPKKNLYELMKEKIGTDKAPVRKPDGSYDEVEEDTHLYDSREVYYDAGVIQGNKFRFYFDAKLGYETDSSSPNAGKVNYIEFRMKTMDHDIYYSKSY